MTRVFAWGLGAEGQLGLGAAHTDNQLVPVRVKSSILSRRARLAVAGGHCSAIVFDDGAVAAWGNNQSGRLGIAGDSRIDTPTIVPGLENIVQLSLGENHGVALDGDGGVWTWGASKCLGVDPPRAASTPALLLLPGRATAVSAGHKRTLVVLEDGRLLAFGGLTADSRTPTPVSGLEDVQIVAAAAGYVHDCAVSAEGRLYTWGGVNKDGELGRVARTPASRNTATAVPDFGHVVAARPSCGSHHAHTLALTSEGLVFAFGSDYKGKLGHGQDRDMPNRPTPVAGLSGQHVVEIVSGGIHAAVRTEDGRVWTFGCGSDGRLGHPEAKGHRYLFKETVPRVVDGLPGRTISLASAYYHMLAVVDTECH